MYKVLIVDDDKVIRQHIKNLFSWEEYQLEVVAEADNGEAALSLIGENEIDIVVTDIYMPVMDGVELIRRTKKEYPNLEFIVISNYDEFKCVKDAMRFGAADYILKYEMDENSFIPVITSVIDNIIRRNNKANIGGALDIDEKWRATLEEKFWRNLLLNQIDYQTTLLDAKRLNIDITSSPFSIILLEINPIYTNTNDYQTIIKGINHYLAENVSIFTEAFKYRFVLKMEENMWIIILKSREKSQLFIKSSCFTVTRELTKSIKQRFDANILVELGDVILKAEEFSGNYKKMKEYTDNKFYYGTDTIIDVTYLNALKTNFENDKMEILKKEFLTYVQNLEFDNAKRSNAAIIEEISGQKFCPSLVYEYFTVLVISLENILEEKGISISEHKGISAEKKLRSFKTLKAIEIYFSEIIIEAQSTLSSTAGNTYRREIQKAIGMIKKNYMNNLSLEFMSEFVGVSKNYFCKLFKEATGENYIDYLNGFRIENAKKLIAGSNKSMKEISSLVGLDYAYFCKVFKSTVGKRPSDLR